MSADPVQIARDAVEAERASRAAAARDLAARDAAVRALFTARPDLGPTAIAREIGLTESTVRGITRDLATQRRAQQD